MKLLVLGGTRFAGRHFTGAALAGGHEVTVFHRGKTNPGLFSGTEGAEEVLGDRDGGLWTLRGVRGRQWDAIVDFCGYVPRLVGQAAAELGNSVERYVFISSISVYADLHVASIPEDAPLKQPPPGEEETEQVTAETYGWLKVLCEQTLAEAMPRRSLIVRPGYIVGPEDYTGRFTWWPWRVAQGGEMLAPGHPNRPLQVLDARDLAGWLLSMVERRATGLFNATGPDRPLTMCGLLETCREVTESDAAFTWVNEKFLQANRAEPPLWVPGEKEGFDCVDSARARAEGLVCRPLADTIRDTLAWVAADPHAKHQPSSWSREHESRLLRRWH